MKPVFVLKAVIRSTFNNGDVRGQGELAPRVGLCCAFRVARLERFYSDLKLYPHLLSTFWIASSKMIARHVPFISPVVLYDDPTICYIENGNIIFCIILAVACIATINHMDTAYQISVGKKVPV